MAESSSNIRVIFGDERLPEFKEIKGKEWVSFGEDNKYPDLLLSLYEKSAKHNALISSKVDYIFGDGSDLEIVPNPYENINTLLKKIITDLEVFGGYYLEVVWSNSGENIAEMYHVPFQNVRVSADEKKYYINDNWEKWTRKAVEKDAFNPLMRKGSQIFSYKQYRAGQQTYALPDYMGAIQYILIDVEISNFHYNNIKTFFSTGKMITFTNGVPTPEEQRLIEKSIAKKHTGTEKTIGFVLNFVDGKDNAPIIENLMPNDFDKQYLQLADTVTNEIFIGHKVISPALFGIATAGALGQRNELMDADLLFYKRYVKPRVNALQDTFNNLFKYVIGNPTLQIKRASSFETEVADAAQKTLQALTTLSPLVSNKIMNSMTENEIRQLASLSALEGGDTIKPQTSDVQFSKVRSLDDELKVFESFGEPSDLYRIIRSKRLRFSQDIEDEDFILSDFDFAISAEEKKVLGIVKNNPKLTVAEIANNLDATPDDVNNWLQSLEDEGIITITDTIDVTDKGLGVIDEKDLLTTEIFVKYKYTGPKDEKNRDFCAKMLDLNRVYTREDIDEMSKILGYSVWERRGGWYSRPGGIIITPYCRHYWSQVIVKRKR